MLQCVTKVPKTVFYSWQSDLPNTTNRGLIGDALARAVKAISADSDVVVDLVVDRDTQSVPGSPDIAVTIFEKIDNAAIFVADVSVVHRGSSDRSFPNPNVLIELGYALKALGDDRVVLILNAEFGGLHELPFDLRRKRVMTYSLPESSDERAKERAELARSIERAIRLILPRLSAVAAAPSYLDLAAVAIRENRPDLEPAISDVTGAIASRIEALQPVPQQPGQFDEVLVSVLPKTTPILVEFARLVEVAARCDSAKAVSAIGKGLRPVLDGYYAPSRGGLSIGDHERGLSEFVGHEMMVMFTALLVRHHRWERLGELLKIRHLVTSSQGRFHVGFDGFCGEVKALEFRKQRLRSNRTSLHADILQERHASSELSSLVPFAELIQADLLLFMATELAPEKSPRETFSPRWVPWSFVLQPSFSYPPLLDDLRSFAVANLVSHALGIGSVDTLRRRYGERFALGLQSCFPGSMHALSVTLPKPETIGSSL